MARGSVGTLFVDLVAKTDQFGRQLDRVERRSKQTEKILKGLTGVVAGIFTARLLASGVRAFVDINREFERLNAQLLTVTGSQAAAAAAFRQLEKFAAETPFSIEQNVQAFIRLRALGIQPTNTMLTDFGNIASGMGRSIEDFARAVQGAVTGETEALKSFGIVSKIQGDKVSFSFQGVTQTVSRNSQEIVAALQKIGQSGFAGAMANEMNTLNGIISNLKDNMGTLARAIGESVLPLLKSMTATVRDLAGAAAILAREGFSAQVFAAQNKHFATLLKQIRQLGDDTDKLSRFQAGLQRSFQLVNQELVRLASEGTTSGMEVFELTQRSLALGTAIELLSGRILPKLTENLDAGAAAANKLAAAMAEVAKIKVTIPGLTNLGLPSGEFDPRAHLGTAFGRGIFGPPAGQIAQNPFNEEQIRRNADAANKLAEAQEFARQMTNQLAVDVVGSFTNMVAGALLQTQRIEQLVIGMLTAIVQQAIAAQRAIALQSGGGGLFGGIFGAIAGPLAGLVGTGLSALFSRRSEPQQVSVADFGSKALAQQRELEESRIIRVTNVIVTPEGVPIDEQRYEFNRRTQRGRTVTIPVRWSAP